MGRGGLKRWTGGEEVPHLRHQKTLSRRPCSHRQRVAEREMGNHGLELNHVPGGTECQQGLWFTSGPTQDHTAAAEILLPLDHRTQAPAAPPISRY